LCNGFYNKDIARWCRRPGLNRHGPFGTEGF
jgi:hypothetical protein